MEDPQRKQRHVIKRSKNGNPATLPIVCLLVARLLARRHLVRRSRPGVASVMHL